MTKGEKQVPCMNTHFHTIFSFIDKIISVLNRFYGYGKNKIQHVHHLRSMGYEFAVIPALGFLTHHPHPKSETKLLWKTETSSLRQDMNSLLNEFASELKKEYEGKVIEETKFC